MYVEPATADEVAFVLRVAADHGLPVSVRGSRHSQSGQCLGERAIALGTRLLSDLHVDPERQCVVAGAGTTWRTILAAAFDVGLLPPGLTLVVDTTIAGTLSVGGVGGESFSIGAQVNNVLYLDVVTLDGQVVRCSPEENRELYDAVRAGLGQCGVIIRAQYPLRRCRPRLRTYTFIYDDAAAFVDDLRDLQREPRAELVLGFVTPSDDGRMSIMLALGKEFADPSELDDGAMASGLRHRRQLPSADAPLWDEGGIPGHVFFRVHTGRHWYRGGAPLLANPWVDHLFTPENAVGALDRLLSKPPAPLRMGTCGLIPVAASGRAAPLFALPGPEPLNIGIGMFPMVPAGFKMEAAAIMNEYSRRFCDAGGKRYLSGFVDFDGHAWATHYGEAWPWFRAMKHRYDPRGLLNPGFIGWG